MADHTYNENNASYWLRQQDGKPIFADLVWSRPENRSLAGKLLIIGGNAYGFVAPAEAYAMAMKAGIGTSQVLLPDAVKPLVGKVLDVGDYAASTPSGSFSQRALGDTLSHANWADGVLLAGDFGRNSETAILLEKFAETYSGQLTLTKDAADYFGASPSAILKRNNTTLVVSFAQLQKFALHAKFTKAFTFDMGLLKLVETLHDFTHAHAANIITRYLDSILVAIGGEISTTRLESNQPIWRVKTAAYASTWWLQNPSRPFQALSTAVYEACQTTSAKDGIKE